MVFFIYQGDVYFKIGPVGVEKTNKVIKNNHRSQNGIRGATTHIHCTRIIAPG